MTLLLELFIGFVRTVFIEVVFEIIIYGFFKLIYKILKRIKAFLINLYNRTLKVKDKK